MRNVLTLTTAASVLALAASGVYAATVAPGANVISSDGLVLQVQKGDEKEPGARGRNGGGKSVEPASKGGERGAREDKGAGKGAAEDQRDRGAQKRSGERGGAPTGSGERRETGARAGGRRTDIEVRGGREDRTTTGRGTRVDIDVERRRRTGGRTGTNIQGYGYTSGSCDEILRRYRQCVRR